MPVKEGFIFNEWDGQEKDDPVWSCRLSCNEGMTFSQAQNCEEQQRKILQNSFPGEFEEHLLKKIHHSFLDLEKLAQKCVKMIDSSALKRGEEVLYVFKENMHQAMVTDVIFKSPKKVKSPNKENNPDCVYDILLVDSNKERNGVSRKSLVRSVATPNLSMMKTFIRAHARRQPAKSSAPWIVDDTFRSIYDIPAKIDLEKMANGNSGEPVQKTFSLFEKMTHSKAKKEKPSKRKGDPDDAKPKKTKSTKPKKELVQKTIADSFATAIKKSQSKEDHDPPKEILDRTTDAYWSLMKKVVTPAWNKTVAFRDECSKMMSETVSEDFLAEFSIKRLGNKPSTKKIVDLKGLRPLPKFQPLSDCVDSDFVSFLGSSGVKFIDVLYLANYFLNTNLVKMRPLQEGQEYSNAELQHSALKLIWDLLKGEKSVAASFWANYISQTNQRDKIRFRSLQVSQRRLKKAGWLALADWDTVFTPEARCRRLVDAADGFIERYPDECTPEKKTLPLGTDRYNRTYWVFFFVTFILVEPDHFSKDWYIIKDPETLKRTIERLDPREANEQALKEVLKDEVEPVKKIFKERADYENDPPTERLSRSQSMDCDFEEIVKSQLIELSEKLYQGQLSNVDEIEALQARISSAEVMPTCEVSIFTFNIDQLRGLIIEVTDSIMDKNIKNPSQLRPPNREKFYDLVEKEEICGLSVLISIVWESVAWENFKQRQTIRSARLRARVNYNED
ncbi:unnamed protein product [Oikopleura dioica]|uniref:WAC domain-containing protein n=1 Tax=Oikopleura dioica TaxID=34765 RepID=E4Y535_OIKDI|nr:unnamed protein product [Oikopleura dioica]